MGAEGVVLCRYQLRAGAPDARECVDVKFGANTIVWGAPSTAFEVVGDAVQPRGA